MISKISSLLLFGVASVAAIAQPSFKQSAKFAQTITADDLRRHLTIVAGAEMEGRETATEGERKAAAYLIEQMKTIGLAPGNNGSYLQPFPVYRDSMTHAALSINGTTANLKKDFTSTASNYPATLRFSELVYVNFDDTAWKNNRIDVSGRLVAFRFKPSPANAPRNERFTNTISAKLRQLQNKGARAALVIADEGLERREGAVLSGMSNDQFPAAQSINYFSISNDLAATLLGKDAEAEKAGKMGSKLVKANVTMDYAEHQINLQSNNVLGILEGSDKKDEYLVITAHYDHIGKQGNVINYGADDDGSGTVAVLELAEAFAKAKAAGKGPRRNILFMLVSGEEKGLWGSEYYGDHPVFPLDKTTANLNIDMIGRIDSLYEKTDTVNYVYVIGQDKLSSDLPALAKMGNTNTKLFLDNKYDDPKDPMRIYYRSDHYNFAKHGVPILFYFDGVHKDYHRPTDTVDKINFDIMTKRAQLVFYTAWETANRNDMLKRDIPLPSSAMNR